MTTLPSKISEIVREFHCGYCDRLQEKDSNCEYDMTLTVDQLLALFKKEMGGIIGKDENLYQKERNKEDWDWRVQREEGGNELRCSQRTKLAKVIKKG